MYTYIYYIYLYNLYMYTDYKQPMSKNQLQSPMSPSKTQLSRIHARAKSEVHRSHTEAWRNPANECVKSATRHGQKQRALAGLRV